MKYETDIVNKKVNSFMINVLKNNGFNMENNNDCIEFYTPSPPPRRPPPSRRGSR